jgi:hypothetical protein
MQSFDYKKLLPHLLVVVGFAVLAFMYSYPSLQGKVLSQGDNISWKGMSREASAYHDSTGKDVLWSNSMFGGMPTYTYYIAGGHNLMWQIQAAFSLLGRPAAFLFVAMLCFFILMCVLEIDMWVGVVGAVAYAFSTYNIVIISAGHETKMWCIAYMPAVIAGLLLIYRSKWLSGMAIMGIAFALMLTDSHYQIVYYTGIIILFAVAGLLFIAVQEKNIKQFVIASLVALVTAAVAFGPNMAVLLTTAEYSKATMRGGESELTLNHDKQKTSGGLDKDYAFQWSNGIGETFCILVPGLYGRADGISAGTNSNTYQAFTKMGVPDEQAQAVADRLPMYWGPQPFISGPTYFGAIICFLFVLGLIVIRSPHKWWIVAVSTLAIIMSWGKNFSGFNYLLFDTLPGLNKFRTPSMVLVIPQFLFPLLGMWALNDIVTGKIDKAEIWKKVKNAAIITVGLCILLGIGGRMFFDFKSPENDAKIAQSFGQQLGSAEKGNDIVRAIVDDRASMATNSALLSALLIAAAAGLLWGFSKNKIKPATLVIALGVLIAGDLIKEDWNYLNERNYTEATEYEATFEPRAVDKQVMADKDPYYRVLDLSRNTYNDAVQAYFHKCIGGYQAAKMEVYQDLIDIQMSRKYNAQVLNMLNTKYIIFNTGQDKQAVQPNADACGNAWFVNEVKWVNTADEEMLALNANFLGDTVKVANAFDPRRTAVVRNTFKSNINTSAFSKDSSAQIKLAQYGLDDISFTSANKQAGLGVFSDMYYAKGWKAFIDGKETPIIKANYVLRALMIPAGNHRIEFHFHPNVFYNADKLAIITCLLLFVAAIGAVVQAIRKGNTTVSDPKMPVANPVKK